MQSLTLKSLIEFYGRDDAKLATHGLVQEANETYLFHGTKVQHTVSERVRCFEGAPYFVLCVSFCLRPGCLFCLSASSSRPHPCRARTQAEVVELIEEHGIDERFGCLDGLFGAGNYFAENASKVSSSAREAEQCRPMIRVHTDHGHVVCSQADQYCTADSGTKLFPMLLVRVCLGSSVGSTGRDGEAEPVVPTLAERMFKKMRVGNPNKYFRNARAVASKMSKVIGFGFECGGALT